MWIYPKTYPYIQVWAAGVNICVSAFIRYLNLPRAGCLNATSSLSAKLNNYFRLLPVYLPNLSIHHGVPSKRQGESPSEPDLVKLLLWLGICPLESPPTWTWYWRVTLWLPLLYFQLSISQFRAVKLWHWHLNSNFPLDLLHFLPYAHIRADLTFT